MSVLTGTSGHFFYDLWPTEALLFRKEVRQRKNFNDWFAFNSEGGNNRHQSCLHERIEIVYCFPNIGHSQAIVVKAGTMKNLTFGNVRSQVRHHLFIVLLGESIPLEEYDYV